MLIQIQNKIAIFATETATRASLHTGFWGVCAHGHPKTHMENVTLAKTRHRSQQIRSLDLRSLDLMTNLQFSSSMLRYDATLKLRKNLGTSRSKLSTLTSSYSPKILVRGFSQLPLEMQKTKPGTLCMQSRNYAIELWPVLSSAAPRALKNAALLQSEA